MNLVEYSKMYKAEEYHWWYVALHKLILTTIQRESERLGRPLKTFDAGCGTGRLCQLLAAHGHNASGCDASDEALRLSSQRGVGTLFHADLNTLELEPETYDVITSIDVLYHTGIVDDVAVMRRLLGGIKPGGILILNLVAHEFLRSTHDIAVHTRERYKKDTLCKRLQEAGFNVEYASYRVCFLFPLIAIWRFFQRFTHHQKETPNNVASDTSMTHPLINIILLEVLKAENLLLGPVTLPIGSSLFAVARKP